jgi:drug/metabolite transporter (DMT)-like permease
VGVVEIPIAAAAGRRFFRERITAAQALGGTLAAAGVALAALA